MHLIGVTRLSYTNQQTHHNNNQRLNVERLHRLGG